jgi:hypothetical protein
VGGPTRSRGGLGCLNNFSASIKWIVCRAEQERRAKVCVSTQNAASIVIDTHYVRIRFISVLT